MDPRSRLPVVRRHRFREYGRVQEAYIWQEMAVEEEFTQVVSPEALHDRHRGQPRFATAPTPGRRTARLAVRYEALDDDLFTVSAPDQEGDIFAKEDEIGTALWIEVQVSNAPLETLPALRSSLGDSWDARPIIKQQIERQIEEIAREYVSNVSSFAVVEGWSEAQQDKQWQQGDYVLTIGYCGGLYTAHLVEAASGLVLMQDGPPTREYYDFHTPSDRMWDRSLGCRPYELAAYSVGEEIGYVNLEELRRILRRTYRKMAAAVLTYQRGERVHFPYADPCCFCQE